MRIIAVSGIAHPVPPHALTCCTMVAYTRLPKRVDGGYVIMQAPSLSHVYKTRKAAYRAIDRVYNTPLTSR